MQAYENLLLFINTCMNTLTTYLYAGDNNVRVNATCFGNCQFVVELYAAIYYGEYIGADQPLAVQPLNLPGLSNVKFNVQLWKGHDNTNYSKFETPKLIDYQNVLDPADNRNCLGTLFIFRSTIITDCDTSSFYRMLWSTGRVEMPYGPDMIYIDAQNGEGIIVNPCD